jgi:predicted RNase H-like nuclease (RuvC/YqgF family)
MKINERIHTQHLEAEIVDLKVQLKRKDERMKYLEGKLNKAKSRCFQIIAAWSIIVIVALSL